MKRMILVLLLVQAGVGLFGQWDDPSEKYADAYKKYLGAKAPIARDGIKNNAYFARDREKIHGHPFLAKGCLEGAPIMYSWAQLEPVKDTYDFSAVEEDLKYLAGYGKRLFVQLQDASFSVEFKSVPPYLLTKEYDGGARRKLHRSNEFR
jgi:hypothetical protein